MNRRLDIQGLRALAVSLVVLYHAQLPLLPGGLIGVDVFYVISGFLIVGLLTDEVGRSGRVGLVTFWSRRVRRLLPASFLVLMVTLLASKLFLPPLLMKPIAGDGAAAALYYANVHFAFKGVNYFSVDSPSPLLHYWSLALEEQFYLFLPLAIALIARFTRKPLRWIVWLLALGSIASFAMCLLITTQWQPLAFFLLPTRAFELGLGGLAAIWVRHRLARGDLDSLRWPPLVGLLGLLAVAASAVLINDHVPFPGWRAAIPVAGTAAILVAGAFHQGRLQQVLSWRPIAWVGDISYSFYLWHWPFLVIPAIAVGHELSAAARAGLVVGSLLAAAVTYRFVEDPVRRWRPAARRPRLTYASAVAVTVVSVLACNVAGRLPDLDAGEPVAASAGGPVADIKPASYIPTNVEPTLAEAGVDGSKALIDGCLIPFTESVPRPCSYGPKGGPTVVLWGDSHAESWSGTLEKLADDHGFHLVTYLKAACPVSDVKAWQTLMQRPFTECDTWREKTLQTIADLKPDLVVLTEQRGRIVIGDNSRTTHAASVAATVGKLHDEGLPVVWLADIPEFQRAVPVCLSAHLHDPETCSEPRSETVDDAYRASEKAAVTAAGGEWVDATAWVCPGTTCAGVAGPYVMYRDRHHLTATYARTLATTMWPYLSSAARGDALHP
ncbi:acyltransferase family protein [Nocardioides cavernaquae]|uniref:acyltransferase family protein n=1 Tax=Nocardioides cavernaquae TaxID=2321396 RepID=UPI001600A526|nr:acyltransferase family protein [Nocardioides cavernaquae]